MLFKRHDPAKDVKTGAIYRRVHHDNIVETAEVLSIGEDSLGIPHVRFRVCFERPPRTFLEDARVLALESFTRQYGGPVGA